MFAAYGIRNNHTRVKAREIVKDGQDRQQRRDITLKLKDGQKSNSGLFEDT